MYNSKEADVVTMIQVDVYLAHLLTRASYHETEFSLCSRPSVNANWFQAKERPNARIQRHWYLSDQKQFYYFLGDASYGLIMGDIWKLYGSYIIASDPFDQWQKKSVEIP